MKKLFLLVSMLVLVTSFSFGNVNQYKVNDQQIENLFNQAQKVDLTTAGVTADFEPFAVVPPKGRKSDKSAAIAFILCWAVGQLGIHRLYLGTETFTWIGYILTCGGICGIVVLVDWVVLLIGLINDDISKYVDNPKFFMW